jgi:putative ABC transport system permease protein
MNHPLDLGSPSHPVAIVTPDERVAESAAPPVAPLSPAYRRRTFLAWQNLTHSWRRLGLAVGGIGFAVLLMTMQIGFRNAMLDSTVAAVDAMNADLLVTSDARYMLSVTESFSRRRLEPVQADPDVAAVYLLYIETRNCWLKNPHTQIGHPIRVFAFNPDEPVFRIPALLDQQQRLKEDNAALFDTLSKRDFGPIRRGTQTELTNQPLTVVGTFELGTDFANDGNLVISAATLSKIFRKPARLSRMFRQAAIASAGLSNVDVGLVKLRPRANVAQVKERLQRQLADDVVLMTKQELKQQERRFWQRSTPVGIIFGIGAAMGFLVGIVFCYQILYSDISDHLAEFATLKAIGYRNRFFVKVVLQEALLLSLFGFLPGLAVSGLLYWWLGEATGLLLDLTLPRALLILGLTVSMCAVSAALTVRKVLSTDPAELF